MKSDKAKLLEFMENLSPDDLSILVSRFQEIAALFEASEPLCPLDNHELTA